jgi:hypothetical protein
VIEGTDTVVALRCSSVGNLIFDSSCGFAPASDYNIGVAWTALKFINSDMYFSQSQLNQLLGALEGTPPRERRRFFERVIGCRRRTRKRWRETPVSVIFSVTDQWYALCQRALACRLREAIASKGLKVYDACLFFDSDKNGLLSCAELLGGCAWLGLDLVQPLDVANLVRAYDMDLDGYLSYMEFMVMLKRDYSSAEPDADADEDESRTPLAGPALVEHQSKEAARLKSILRQQSVGGTEYESCQPLCEEELCALQEAWLQEQLAAEEAFQRDKVRRGGFRGRHVGSVVCCRPLDALRLCCCVGPGGAGGVPRVGERSGPAPCPEGAISQPPGSERMLRWLV